MKKATSGKRKCEWISPSFDDVGSTTTTRKTTQNLVRHNSIEKKQVSTNQNDICEDWLDKYAPNNLEELCVNKKKVTEVSDWIQCYTKENLAGVLLLTGPAGCGKSAMLKVLAKEHDFNLKEWINPVTQQFHNDENSWRDFGAVQDSQQRQFSDFLLRANRYDAVTGTGCHCDTVVMVEDLPNFAVYRPEKLHTILREYALHGRSPLVFVISDTQTTSGCNLYQLFPKHIQREINMHTISLNAVPVTTLTKTMSRIIEKEEESSSLVAPTKEIYSMLATSCCGDVRSCINSLQFYCCADGPNVTTSKTKKKHSTKRTAGGKSKRKEGADCLNGRDSSLFLFHALGKVLYCKRLEELEKEASQLKGSLRCHKRNTLSFNPEDVYGKSHMTSDNFVLYLHQNFLDFFTNIDDVTSAGDYFSDADIISSVWSPRDSLSDYSACVGMRGLMFSNTHAQVGGTKWRPLHKPEWFNAYRTIKQRFEGLSSDIQVRRHPSSNLLNDVLPFSAKITPPTDQIERELAFFNTNKFPQRSLQAVRDGEVDDEKVERNFYGNRNIHIKTENDLNFQNLQDDDVIDDFDD